MIYPNIDKHKKQFVQHLNISKLIFFNFNEIFRNHCQETNHIKFKEKNTTYDLNFSYNKYSKIRKRISSFYEDLANINLFNLNKIKSTKRILINNTRKDISFKRNINDRPFNKSTNYPSEQNIKFYPLTPRNSTIQNLKENSIILKFCKTNGPRTIIKKYPIVSPNILVK